MRRRPRLPSWLPRCLTIAVALLLTLLVAGPASAGPATDQPAAPSRPRGPVYLALGDSVAFGIGASDPAVTGYVPRLHGVLREELRCWPRPDCPRLALDNLAVPGATTTSLIADQLTPAVAQLRARNWDLDPFNDVKVVTIDIGGNDAFAAVPSCLDPTTAQCKAAVDTQLSTFETNFPVILRRLRIAAGPFARVVTMTYYNPLPSCRLAPLASLGEAVLEGATPLVERGLNDLIRSISATYHVRVAETYGQLGPDDLVGGADCLHPNDAGHQVIADRFATTLGLGRKAA
jgi:lysophospholipase L1-like esterase